jgi:hypothetical protein
VHTAIAVYQTLNCKAGGGGGVVEAEDRGRRTGGRKPHKLQATWVRVKT